MAADRENIDSLDVTPALDIDDLLNKSKMAGEGIASYKDNPPKMKGFLDKSTSFPSGESESLPCEREEYPIDFKGVGALNNLLYENQNLKAEELRETIKSISEDQVRSHILRIQKELSLLGKCLSQMDYKYLSLKTTYASKDLDQILEVFKRGICINLFKLSNSDLNSFSFQKLFYLS